MIEIDWKTREIDDERYWILYEKNEEYKQFVCVLNF